MIEPYSRWKPIANLGELVQFGEFAKFHEPNNYKKKPHTFGLGCDDFFFISRPMGGVVPDK